MLQQEDKDTIKLNLMAVARTLEIDGSLISQAITRLATDFSNNAPLDAFHSLLGPWIQAKSTNATLEALCVAFEENGLQNFSVKLRDEFGTF